MADYDDFDFEDEQPRQGKSQLRLYIESLKDTVDKLVAQNDALAKENALTKVGSLVVAKGYDPQVADLIPAELRTDPAKVESWLTEKGSLFVRKDKEVAPPADSAPPQPPQPQTPNPGIDPALIAAQQRIDNVQAQALTPQIAQGLDASIRGAASAEDVLATLRAISLGQQ